MQFVKLKYHLIMGVCDARACPEVGSGAGAGCTRRSLLFRDVVAVLIDLGGVGRSSVGLCLLQQNTRTSSSCCHTAPFVGVSTVAEAGLGSCSPVLLLGNELTVCSQQIPASKFQCFQG